MGLKVKICGITNAEDALKAVELEADFVGFNFYEKSPRHVTPQTAKNIIEKLHGKVKAVGVFVNENADQINTAAKYCGLGFVQLHGTETPDFCEKIKLPVIKAFRVEDDGTFKQIALFDVDYILLDAFSPVRYGGTGKQIKEEFMPLIKELVAKQKTFLSGGLAPENVHALVQAVAPFAVDVASGVESAPGKKDYNKMRAFISEAKK